MLNILLSNSGFYTWLILPLLIFLARVLDVSIGTVRVIFISRGLKYLAPIVGFFEILIWLLAIGQIMKNLSNPLEIAVNHPLSNWWNLQEVLLFDSPCTHHPIPKRYRKGSNYPKGSQPWYLRCITCR